MAVVGEFDRVVVGQYEKLVESSRVIEL